VAPDAIELTQTLSNAEWPLRHCLPGRPLS
jgi:hypothetical protein